MAECQSTESNRELSNHINSLENSYPTHNEGSSVKNCITGKSDKHLPNGVKIVSSEVNGLANCSHEHEEKTEVEEEPGDCSSLTSCLNRECGDTECDSSKSIDTHVVDLTSNLDVLSVGSDESDVKDVFNGIDYVVYKSEVQMPDIMRLITKDLSEPYSIYTYRYFIHNWPKLCFLAMDEDKCVGAIVCKLDMHKKMVRRGYIAMLAVDSEYRRKKIGSHLVLKAIKAMIADDCDEVVLETEITNQAALRLYENLGFVRDKRLFRYYLNGVDALRLKLWLR